MRRPARAPPWRRPWPLRGWAPVHAGGAGSRQRLNATQHSHHCCCHLPHPCPSYPRRNTSEAAHLQAVRDADRPRRHVDQGLGDEEGAEPPQLALGLRAAGAEDLSALSRRSSAVKPASHACRVPNSSDACGTTGSKQQAGGKGAGPLPSYQQHPRLSHVCGAAHAGADGHARSPPLLLRLGPPPCILQRLWILVVRYAVRGTG